MFKRNFIVQQGFDEPAEASCSARFGVLQFQPRVVLVFFLAAVWFQSAALFQTLAGLLMLGAVFPRLNLFEMLYNATLGRRAGADELFPAPAPRRFSQALASAFCASIAVSIYLGWKTAAAILQGIMGTALAGLVLFGFCLGSMVFHMLRGRAAFAISTLPWK